MPEERAFTAPKGTYDLLPPESWRWVDGARRALDSFAGAGYAPVETPAFEHTEVFERGVGATSEVVGKQMYTFLDKGGRSLTLRPEGTAPVMRAVLEHHLERGALPVKLAYASFMFRQERPQKGRFRQFFQVGIENIGSDDPVVDAEVIEVGARYLRDMGVRCTLLLNSIGHPAESCRGGYVKLLADWLRDRGDDLAPVDRERVESNPLRTFDSKEAATIEVMAEAPLITDHLCDSCAGHFADVRSLLDDVAVEHELEPRLVRGLDYYTRTAFEFVSSDLGSQSAVGGGGRYDGLAESLGGEPLPGIGFALGLDRILLASSEPAEAPRSIDAYVVTATPDARRTAWALATRLRGEGFGIELDLAGRSMKGQMKDAGRSGARWAVILGPDELAAGTATVRDLATGDQETVPQDELGRRLA
ncbi:MAG TPA: histidine--tRNA ligase [Actinomycetota bacterium]|nr:histidine--tRNA ligase [Actinomycetota bacterium]